VRDRPTPELDDPAQKNKNTHLQSDECAPAARAIESPSATFVVANKVMASNECEVKIIDLAM
jgi:hypothetical protein